MALQVETGPFTCSKCGAGPYKFKRHLGMHMKMKHGVAGKAESSRLRARKNIELYGTPTKPRGLRHVNPRVIKPAPNAAIEAKRKKWREEKARRIAKAKAVEAKARGVQKKATAITIHSPNGHMVKRGEDYHQTVGFVAANVMRSIELAAVNRNIHEPLAQFRQDVLNYLVSLDK